MGIQVVTIATAHATNSVAASTAVDLTAAAQLETGPVFPNIGGNSVLRYLLDPGATPAAFDIEIQESNLVDSAFSTVVALDEATVGNDRMLNVTITKKYVRVSIVEATANAGTISAWLISA